MSDPRSMNSLVSSISRREWLKATGCGFGYLALAGLCAEQAAADASAEGPASRPAYLNPLAPKPTHFKAKAKRVIMLFMQGGPSHVDTFDYKPKLQQDSGKPGERGMLLGSPFKFEQHGSGGLWISELFPNIAKHADEMCVINGMHTDNPAHPQATIQLHTGTATFVRPSMGAWVLYGLGTTNQNLPGFITINPPSGLGGAQNYGSSFLPAAYQGTRLGARGEMADVISPEPLGEQRRQLDLLQSMNRDFAPRSGAPDQIDGVIQSFELGFRMQSQLPELLNISKESPATLQMYGIEGGVGASITERQRRAGPNSDNFARQCLMARRLAQAGVRFIEVCHPGWDQHNNLHQAMTRTLFDRSRRSAPFSRISNRTECWKTRSSSGAANSDALRPARAATAAITTTAATPCGWPAAEPKVEPPGERPMITAQPPSKIRSTRTIYTPQSWPCSASTTSVSRIDMQVGISG